LDAARTIRVAAAEERPIEAAAMVITLMKSRRGRPRFKLGGGKPGWASHRLIETSCVPDKDLAKGAPLNGVGAARGFTARIACFCCRFRVPAAQGCEASALEGAPGSQSLRETIERTAGFAPAHRPGRSRPLFCSRIRWRLPCCGDDDGVDGPGRRRTGAGGGRR